MALFTERSITKYLDRLIAIHPLRAESITGVGYDLSVGLYAKVDPRRKAIVSVQVCDEPSFAQISLERDTYVIVISREHVYLSSRVAATFHSKSSLAAQAVFLNSTTGDPNWRGRLIFSLYNASGITVDLDLDATFATMVLHDTKRPSRIKPKESKAVIQKYLKGLTGEHDKIVGYVMRHDESANEFDERADRVRRLASLPSPVFHLWIGVQSTFRLLRKFRFTVLFASVTVLLLLGAPALFAARPTLAELAQYAAIVSAVLALVGLIRKW